MDFTFPIPDLTQEAVIDVILPSGEVQPGLAPEVGSGIDTVLQQQQQAIAAILQAIAGAIQQQLVAQQQAIGALWQGIVPVIQQQIIGQQAIISQLVSQIQQWIQFQLAQQGEWVMTPAITIATGGPPPPPSMPRPVGFPSTGEPARPGSADRPPPPGGVPPPPGQPPPPPWDRPPRFPGTPGQPIPPGMPPLPPWPPPPSGSEPGGTTPIPPPTSPPGGLPPFAGDGGNVPPPSGTPPLGTPPGGPYPPGAPPDDTFERGDSGGPVGAPGGTQTTTTSVGDTIRGGDTITTTQRGGDTFVTYQTTNIDDRDTTTTTYQYDQEGRPISEASAEASALAQIFGVEKPVEDGRRIDVEAEGDERADGQPKPAPARDPAVGCQWTIRDRIPPIGGPEWCAKQADIQAALADIGKGILTLMLRPVETTAELWSGPGMAARIARWEANVDPVSSLLAALVKPVPQVMTTISQMVDCWRQIARAAPGCNPEVFMGLCVVRALVRSFNRVMVGCDLCVWLTLDFSVDLTQLERAVTYLIESACPSMIPTAREAWAAYAAGAINEAQWRCWTMMDGEDPDLWRPVREATGHVVAADQVILWGRMHGAPEQQIDAALYARGWTRAEDRAAAQWMYDRVPDGEKWIAWEAAGALDVGAEMLLRRDEGFKEFWADRPGQLARAHGMTEEWARNSWRATQPLPAMQELLPLLWRCRPGRVDPTLVLTTDDVRIVLDAGRVPPGVRDRFMETLYRAVMPHDAQQQQRMGVANRDTLQESFLDFGYSPTDVPAVERAARYEAERERASQEQGWTLSAALQQRFVEGEFTEEVEAALRRQGFTAAAIGRARRAHRITLQAMLIRRGMLRATNQTVRAVMKAYSVGLTTKENAAPMLEGLGFRPQDVSGLLDSIDMQLAAQRVERGIQQIRRGFMRGEITPLGAMTALESAEITDVRRKQLVRAWQVEAGASRPMAHVMEIRRWVTLGLLPLASARARLHNLGWRDPDLTLLVAEFGQRLAKAQAQARSKGIAAAQSAAKAAGRVRQQALRRLEKSQPVSALGQWYKDGEIGPVEVRTRMKRYGYDDYSINLYIQGWDHQRARALASKTEAKPLRDKTPQQQVPLSQVKRWYVAGIVDRPWSEKRLADYGYEPQIVRRYLAEWDEQRAIRAEKDHEANGVERADLPD